MKTSLEIFAQNLRNTLEAQRKIAELSKNAPLKTQNFVSNWKDLYLRLDDEHRRSFWRNLVSEIVVTQQGQGFQIMY